MFASLASSVLAICLVAQQHETAHRQIMLATAYLERHDYREAETLLRTTVLQPLDRVGRGELLNAWSALHMALGRFSDAEADLRPALPIVRELPNPGDLLPTILHNLAAAEMRTGDYAQALSHEQDSLRLLEQETSPDQPILIHVWASLASVQFLNRQAREANASMRQALALTRNTYGPQDALVADLLESHAVILDQLKLKKEARLDRERARKIRNSTGTAPSGQPYFSSTRTENEGATVFLRSR